MRIFSDECLHSLQQERYLSGGFDFFMLYSGGCFMDSIRWVAPVMSVFVMMDGCLSHVSGRLSRSALIKCGLNCECLPDPHRRTNTRWSKVREHRTSVSHNQKLQIADEQGPTFLDERSARHIWVPVHLHTAAAAVCVSESDLCYIRLNIMAGVTG